MGQPHGYRRTSFGVSWLTRTSFWPCLLTRTSFWSSGAKLQHLCPDFSGAQLCKHQTVIFSECDCHFI